jgi:hypothetical protein
LKNWLREHPNASHRDKLVARSLMLDLKGALNGK